MKKVFKLTSLVFVLAVILSFFTVTVGASTYPSEDYWATEALNAAVKNQILYGKENGNLDPEVNLTRAEMAAIIVRAFGANIKTDISRFYDVSSSQWYYDDIAKAVHMGVFVGDAGNTMRPDDPIIREEAFTVLARALVLSSSDYSSLNRFTDSWNISAWAKEYLSILAKKGYVNGNQDSEITPKDNITRAEFAQFMHNIFKTYFVTGGTYSSTGADSSLIRHENINLSNLTVPGDLVIGDGANLSTVTLTNVKVQGRLLVRGAATVKLVNVTVGENVVVKNINSNVHFDNYRTETVFNNINIITSATFKTDATGGGGGGGGGGGTPPPGPLLTATITLDANGGTGVPATVTLLLNSQFGTQLPTPTKSGYIFAGWYYQNQSPVNPTDLASGNMTLVAHWTPDTGKYTVTFNPDGGTVSPETKTVDKNTAVGTLPTPTKEGYTFGGWFIGANQVDENYTVTGNVTFTAKWIPNVYTITFNADGGTVTPATKQINYNDKVGTLPIPTKDGYTFNGWYAGNVQVDANYVVTDNVTFIAKWSAKTYTITFDANGGNQVTPSFVTVTYGETYQTLPVPTHSNPAMNFAGWFVGINQIVEGGTVAITENSTAKAKWTDKDVFKVEIKNYKANGDSITLDVIDGEKIIKPENPSKEGYTFKGYFADSGLTTQVDFTQPVTANLTIYTKWQINTYKVKFNSNTGSGTMAELSFEYNEQKALTLNGFTKTGYTFKGWAQTPTGNVMYTDGQSVKNLSVENGAVIDLYAIWEAITYNVAFDVNGGQGQMQNQTLTYDVEANLTANAFTKNGYTFKGWNTLSDGSGIFYSDSQAVKNLLDTQGTYTLYAIWEANTYYVAYNSSNGTGTMSNSTHKYGTTSALSTNVFEKEGYQFIGWSKTQGGTTVDLTDGEVISDLTAENGATVTLYAVWKANNYTVKFDKNDLMATGTMADQSFTYDVEKTLSSNAYTKTGYKFAGWATTPDGQKVYDNNHSVKKLTAENGGVVTLYAVWQKETYTVTFNADGGSVNPSSMTVTYDSTYNNLPIPTKDGYNFVGWFIDGAQVSDGMKVTVTENKTAVAKWTEKVVHTINFINYDGNGTTVQQKVENESAVTEPLKPSKDGWKFDGWFTDDTFATSYTFGTVINEQTAQIINIYAKWTANTYKVSFNANGGTGTMADQNFTYDETKNLTLNSFTKTGYTFKGWAFYPNGMKMLENENSVSNLTKEDNGTVALYAVWEANTYYVSYNASNGTGTMINSTHKYDTLSQLTLNAFTKEGYHFIGWSKTQGGTTVDLTDGTAVSTLTTQKDGVVTLYAVWEANTYYVSYNGNGGTGSMPNSTFTYDVSGTLTANTFTRTGYTFRGWSLTQNGTKAYDNGAAVTNLTAVNNGTVTLYAVWTPVTYIVRYNAINATGGQMTDDTFTFDTSYNLKQNGFERTGYTFLGWAEIDGATTIKYADKNLVKNLADTQDEVFNLYAVWEANSYTVRYVGTYATNTSSVGQTYESKHVYDETDNLTPNLFERTGYTFLGWTTVNPNPSLRTFALLRNTAGVIYEDLDEIKNLAAEDGAVVELYPVWEANTYYVAFNGNGATNGSMSDQELTYDVETALTSNGYTRTGYKFVGWATDAQGQKVYDNNALVKNLASEKGEIFTLYAVWEEISYTVSFNGNGATSGTVADQTFKYTETKALSDNQFVKTGHTFLGWSTNSNATTATYTDKAQVSKLRDTEGTVTLYAIWKANEYTLTFDVNGGNQVTPSSITVTYGANYPSLPQPTMNGKYFAGWFTDKDIWTKEIKQGNIVEITANTTVYAKWTDKVPYTVTFVGFNADGSNKTETVLSGEKAVKPTADPQKEGHTFGGYFADNTYSTTFDFDNTVINSNTSIYVKWTANTYTVTFDANGGTTATSEIKVEYNKAVGELPSATRDGYAFGGWYVEDTKVDATYVVKGDVTFKAKWIANAYTVTLDANGGTVTPATIPVEYNKQVGTLPTPEKTGYTFDGWYIQDTKVDASYVVKGDVTFTAKWTAKTYTLLFNANGGSVTPDRMEVTYDANYQSLPTPTHSDSQMKFAGWYTDKVNWTGEIKAGNKVEITQNTEVFARWTNKETFTVTFKGFNTDGTDKTETVIDGETVTNHGTLTEEGYTFGGYYADSSYQTQFDFDTAITKDTTIYVKWTLNTFTVTLFPNGGTVNPSEIVVSYNNKVGTLPIPERKGYNFLGWYLDGTLVNENYVVKENVTFKAKWEAKRFKIKFNGQGNTDGEMNDITYVYGTVQQLNTNLFVKTGYIFRGWAFKTDKDNVIFTNGQNLHTWLPAESLVEPDGTINLYAVWKPITYRVHFVGNGASGSMMYMDFVYDVEQKLTKNTFVREGYNFGGWNTEENGTGITYEDEESVKNLTSEYDGKDVFLYAIWNGVQSTVTFDVNGGNSVTPATMDVTYGDKYAGLPTPTHSDTTMNFAGWYIEGTDILVTNGATVTIINDVTLVAKWAQDIYYNVTFNTDGGTSIAPQSVIENGKATRPAVDPEKTGYAFKGWYKDASFINEYDFNSKVVSDTVIYAKWAANKYTVKFHPNGGTGSMADMPFAYDVEQALAENTFEREGYTFVNWFMVTDGVERNFADKESVKNLTSEDGVVVTLYAKWEAKRYTVSFDSNGGTDVSSQSVEYGKTAVKPTDPSRYGYTFDGWYVGDELYNFATPLKKDIALTARWIPQTYTVIYSGNGATGGTHPNSTFKYDTTYRLPANGYEKTGYGFKGWAETSDGPVKYKDYQDGLYNLAEPNGTITLYAVWEPNEYTILYDGNDGQIWDSYTSVIFDSNVTVANGYNAAKWGYTLKEWNTKKDGSGTTYALGQTFKYNIPKDITLYAIWQPNEYRITFDTMGEGTVTPNFITVTFDGKYPELPTPAGTSQNFVRWEIDGVEIRQGMTVDITEAKTAKAIYSTKNVYTVTIKDYNGTGNDYVYTLEEGSTIKQPSDPTVTGLTLEGYYTDNTYSTRYIWGDTILGSVIIYAKLEVSKYDVTFKASSQIGGENVTTHGNRFVIRDVPYGTVIRPNDYYAEDYQSVLTGNHYFQNWMIDDERLPADKDFEYVITSDITFEAYYTVKAQEAGGKNYVQFVTNGGSYVEPQTVEAYHRVQKPQDPEKDGYTFVGWYTDSQLTNEFDFETALETNQTLILFAKWAKESYTVSFVDTILGTVTAPVTVNYNETMEGKMPSDPVADGWKFDGWYTDEFRTNLFDATTKITEDITLYAFWLKDVGSGTTYRVSFDTKSDITIPDVYVAKGLPVTEPMVIMTKDGYRFDAWYLNGTVYNFNLPVESDITLVANWIKVYKVSFETDGGSAVAPITVDENKTATKPLTDPEKDGFVFFGWFTDKECSDENKFDFSTPITSDITLYAKWVDEEDLTPVKVTFHYNAWTGDTLAGDPIELYAGQSIDNVTLKDKKYADVDFFDEDSVYAGYVKDSSVSDIYTEKYQDMLEYDWWYQDADGRWQLFDENVVVNSDMDVFLKVKRISININAPSLSKNPFTFNVFYEDDTRIIDSIKNLMYTQDTVYILNNGGRSNGHLEVINLARDLLTQDDKIIEKLIEKNIIDENYNILIQEIMVRYSQVLGEENVEKFIVDSAKEQLDGSNEKLIEEFVEYFDKMATSTDASDKAYIKDMLAKSIVYTNQQQHIKDYTEMHFSKDFLVSLGFTETEAEHITKDKFHEWIENNTNEVIAKVVDYIVDNDDVEEIDNYSHIVVEYLDNHQDVKDEVVDGIIETNYRADLDKLVYEVNNKDKFTVNERTIFIANGLKAKLEKDYSYKSIISKVPAKIIDKVFEIYPEEKAKEIYNGAFESLKTQTEQAMDDLENGAEVAYIDCGLNFIINPVDDIYTPLYNSFVDILENDSRADKIKDKIKYDENEYLPELVELLSVKSLFNGDIANETTTHSGYQLKDFNYYYNLVLNAVILGDDAVTKYKELFSEDEIDEILVGYEDLALKYANILAEFLDGYANGTKDPDNKYFDKVEGIIKSKFPEQFDKLLNWYKDSPINKKYESDDYAKFRKAVREAYERYDMITDAIFDDEYIDKALSKLDKILVAENTTYTDFNGTTHNNADIYEITVKGKTGRFVVVNEDIYEISIEGNVITIAREWQN